MPYKKVRTLIGIKKNDNHSPKNWVEKEKTIMTGWEKCEQLKKIRKIIADANDIPYEVEECEHLEECIGTCPKCDEEAEYINKALAYRAKAGKKIVVDGLLGDLFEGEVEIIPEKHPQAKKRRGNSQTRRKYKEEITRGRIEVEGTVDGGFNIDYDIVDSEDVLPFS